MFKTLSLKRMKNLMRKDTALKLLMRLLRITKEDIKATLIQPQSFDKEMERTLIQILTSSIKENGIRDARMVRGYF